MSRSQERARSTCPLLTTGNCPPSPPPWGRLSPSAAALPSPHLFLSRENPSQVQMLVGSNANETAHSRERGLPGLGPWSSSVPEILWLPAGTGGPRALTQCLNIHVRQHSPLLCDLGPAAIRILDPLGGSAVVGACIVRLGTAQHHAVPLGPLLAQPQLPGCTFFFQA